MTQHTADSPVEASAVVAENPPYRWLDRLTSPLAAVLVLAVFWVFMLCSVKDASLTSDEIVHATAGYTYWKFNDYRLNPENGILPQRLIGLPLVLSHYQPPPRDAEAWHNSDEWTVGDVWFHKLGNDLPSMLLKGRAAIGVLTLLLGVLVWWWARRLFGRVGGMLSLLLFVASPIVLANGALMTSDAACSLFFLAAVTSVWAVLHRLTVGRLLVSGLIVGGLFASKMSAVLIVPIGLILAIVRLASGRPLWLGFGLDRQLTRRWQQALAFGGAAIGHALLVLAVLWGCYGFRYTAFAPPISEQDRFQQPWDLVLEKPDPLSVLTTLELTADQKTRAQDILDHFDNREGGTSAVAAIRQSVLTPAQIDRFDRAMLARPLAPAAKVFEFVRAHRLLPEGYIYGYAHAWRFARRRAAFFNGEYGISGWKTFFPYTFLVKTPLPVFAIMGLAIAAVAVKWRANGRAAGITRWRQIASSAYATMPLWALLLVYWAAVIPSRLNIGHRHIMATYAPLFVLCGAAAYWLEAGWMKCRSISRWRAGSPDPAETLSAVGSGSSSDDCAIPPSKRSAKMAGIAVGLLVGGLFAEIAYRYPHYIAYFNGIVSPRDAYRHLIDSSLDWGQDLPGLKRYLERHPSPGPVYLSYFGTASPAYYGISAKYLFSAAGLDQPRTPIRQLHTTTAQLETEMAAAKREWPDCEPMRKTFLPDGNVSVSFLQQPTVPRLAAGTYFISATMLPAIWFSADGPLGPWNERFEATYQELERTIQPLLVANLHEQAEAFGSLSADRWSEVFEAFAQYRFARLTAFLRQREPDDQIGGSILVYRLSDADIERALHGPPAELGIDFPATLAKHGEL